jgi:hypothetical protein
MMAPPVRAQTQAADVPGLRSAYEDACRKIGGDADAARAMLSRQYLDLLRKSEAEFKNQGKLESTVALRNEIARFTAEPAVPESGAIGTAPEVASLQNRFREAAAGISKRYNEDYLRISKAYIAQLETMKVSLTRQDKLKEAMGVSAEIDFLVSSSRYRDAVASVKPEEDPSSKTSPTPVSCRTLTVSRKLDIQGGLTGSWTSLPLNLIPGDIVSIKASGGWVLPPMDSACGPEGYPRALFEKRHSQEIPYGAIVMRVGNNGPIKAVGESIVFTNTVPGILSMDGNAADDRRLRARSSGHMNIDIVVRRPLGR